MGQRSRLNLSLGPLSPGSSRESKKRKLLRQLEPSNLLTSFLEDYSQRTLERRRMQIPKLIDARERRKLTFFVMDRLIIKDKPPGRDAVNKSK